ncbi:MAG: excinuclease ABC subunit UvrA [Thermoguttaceae bacterium]|nr:excinuclease ABC subunit UvrA [Thermoguttaceae bacterium]
MAPAESNGDLNSKRIVIRGARAHNLKSVNLDVPYYKITTFCGLSGSGKSSMAVDVLYAEGRRRYVECFAPSVRAKLEKIEKPDVDLVEGSLAAVAIAGQQGAKTSNSTLGAATEISDYLRALFAKVGTPHCPICGRKMLQGAPNDVCEELEKREGARAMICFAPPTPKGRRESVADFEQEWRQKGFHRIIVGKNTFDLNDPDGVPLASYSSAFFFERANEPYSAKQYLEGGGLQSPSSTFINIPQKYRPAEAQNENDSFEEDGDERRDSSALMLDPDGNYEKIKERLRKRYDVVRRTEPPRILLVVDRVTIGKSSRDRIIGSIETAYEQTDSQCWILLQDDPSRKNDGDANAQTAFGNPFTLDGAAWELACFSRQMRCNSCGVEFSPLEPGLFSYSSSIGACEVCGGAGRIPRFDEALIIPDPERTIRRGAIAPWKTGAYRARFDELVEKADELGIRLDVPFKNLTREERKTLFQGSKRANFAGLNGFFSELLQEKYKMHIRAFLARYQRSVECLLCHGSRLKKEALCVEVHGQNFNDVMSRPIVESRRALEETRFTEKERARGAVAIKQTIAKMKFLEQVGLGYLTLNRAIKTLSSGERRRAALAKALGSDLVDMLYVLDEPTNGLHPKDCEALVDALRQLRDRGSTLVVVDHNKDVLEASDLIVEFGPEAGSNGGKIVFQGTADELKKSDTITGGYLSGARFASPSKRRAMDDPDYALQLNGATGYNLKLKDVDVSFPLGTLCLVTGVSGAGKSALVNETLYPALCDKLGLDAREIAEPLPYSSLIGAKLVEDVAFVDQTPIGRTPRSNPVTFMKIFDDIRALYADSPEAKSRGFTAGYFSFNVDGGRCDRCKGEGYIQTDMQFLADVYARCPSCGGKRYKESALEALVRTKNIAEALDMTVLEAFAFFKGQTKIQQKLKKMIDVGLGYLKLGQPGNTLSGGESQRLKLASKLASSHKSKCLYILDEPTSGLHFADVVRLVDCFHDIVDSGSSVIAIDHNPSLIMAADYVIDLGPGAGDEGGQIVAAGRPEEIASNPNSVTGRYLARVMERRGTTAR